jgi:osmotically-inducible protein OsmY
MSWLGYHIARGFGDLVQRELAAPGDRGDDYILPDERARQRACAGLAADPDIDAGDIEVRVLSGALRLSGTVPAEPMKARAAQLCATIPGVESVDDALTVR